MTILHQYPLSYFENMAEVYVPTAEELKAGKWALIFERLDEDGQPDLSMPGHTIPIRDPIHHLISGTCWCSPTKENCENGLELWNHRISQ
jgi:hypothetical protein